MSDDADALRSTTCVVTGGVGFLGSYLCERLARAGARVVAIDIEDAHPGTFFSHKCSHERVRAITQDCAAGVAVNLIREISPDYIFHLAGLPYAPYTTAHRDEAFAANVTTTETVLEAASKLSGARLVFSSSACVFGAAQESPLTLSSPYSRPAHYYTVTKRQAEEIVLGYRESRGINATICRFGNIYGPGDRHFGRIVPQICSQLIAEAREYITLRRSSGTSIFEFLYVDDAVEGLLRAAGKKALDQPVWHFTGGPENRVDILGLASLMSLAYDGKKRDVIPCQIEPEIGVTKYLDDSATRKHLGFAPASNLSDGLRRTLNWYRSHINDLKPHPSA